MKRTPLKRKPRQRELAHIVRAKRTWKATACRGGCLMCQAFPVARELRDTRIEDFRRIEGHHVVAKRHLKVEGFASRLWDTRNCVGLCFYHHQRHENAVQRVPYALLPAGALEFALEVGLEHKLLREYAP